MEQLAFPLELPELEGTPAPAASTATGPTRVTAPASGSSRPRSPFLSGIAAVFAAVQTSPAFAAAITAAHQAAVGHNGRAEAGNAFEAALAAQLDRTTQQSVSDETASALAATFPDGVVPGFTGPFTQLRWHYLGDRKGAPCDFLAVATFGTVGAVTATIPVNAKYNSSPACGNDATSVANLLRVALGRDVTDHRRLAVDALLTEWFAGRHRIARADYYILSVRRDPATSHLIGWHFQGLLSAVTPDGSRLAISRNTKREGVLYDDASAVLGDDFDVNTAFATALSPRPDPDAFRLILLGFLGAQLGLDDTGRKQLANQLLATDPATLAATLATALQASATAGASGEAAGGLRAA